MFIATRIANGIIALLALLASIMLAFWGGSAMKSVAAMLFLVALFFVGDLIFRKKNSSGDMFFAASWTALFLWNTYVDTKDAFAGTFPEFGGTLFVICIIAIGDMAPLLLNGIYLVRLLSQERKEV